MRRSNMLWLLLAGLCSAALYHTSQRVHDGRELLDALNRETAQEEESIRVLQAEWSYLNQPQRLETLAREHLKLVPMKGDRFAAIDDIALRAVPAADKDEQPAPAKPSVAEKPAAVKPPVPSATAVAGTGKPAASVKPPVAEKPAVAEGKAVARQTAAALESPVRATPAQKVVRKQEAPARGMRDVMKSLGVD